MSTAVPSINLLPPLALGATALTVLAAPALSLLVAAGIRVAVRRSMRSAGRTSAEPAPPLPGAPATAPRLPGHPVAPEPVSASRPADPRPGSLTAIASGRLRRVVGWYLAAGLSYAVLTAVILLTTNGQDLLPVRTILISWVFAWPLVPTLALVCAWSWRATGLLMAGYFGALAALGLIGSAGIGAALLLWALYMLPPSLIVAAVAPRRLRAIGPFLAPSVFVLGLGFLTWPGIALAMLAAGVTVELVEPVTFALIALAARRRPGGAAGGRLATPTQGGE